jgi:hypothetical protein
LQQYIKWCIKFTKLNQLSSWISKMQSPHQEESFNKLMRNSANKWSS